MVFILQTYKFSPALVKQTTMTNDLRINGKVIDATMIEYNR